MEEWDEGVEHPEALLEEIVQYAVDGALRVARQQNQHPDRLIVLIDSPLLDSSIAVHIQDLNENAVESIVRRFEVVNQSNRAKDRGSLYGAPFSVDVTALSHQQLKNAPPPKKMGRGRPPRLAAQHNIDPNALITIKNTDGNLCLFRAVNILRARETMGPVAFYCYLDDQEAQKNDVAALMKRLAIPYAPAYCLEDYGKVLVQHLNMEYTPKRFKIFGFTDSGRYKPYYQSSTDNQFDVAVCIYYHDNHFAPIKNINTFFKSRNYCLACCKPYDKQLEHNNQCVIRCNKCCTVDASRCPCPPDDVVYEQKCEDCHKTFTNRFFSKNQ